MPWELSPIVQPRVLVVEGHDEEGFFEELIEHLGHHDVQVVNVQGKDMGPRLRTVVNAPGFRQVVSLGVERDANSDPAGALQSVRGALLNAGLPAPAEPLEPVQEADLRVTVMLLPGLGRAGALEDACLASVTERPEWECVEGLFRCLHEKGLPEPVQRAKARVHAYLATAPNPMLRVGEAAKRRYWDLDHPAFEDIRRFLRLVAGEA